MSSLRIIYDNAADRATLVASSSAGSLTVNNLLTDVKSEVWRSTSAVSTITATWPAGELCGAVALPFSSLSSAALMRVRAYTHAADTTPVIDTGFVAACASADFDNMEWGKMPLGVNSYSYGGGTYGVVWFDVVSAEKLVIDIDDSSNPLGYIEASRIVTGTYWSPLYNADYGAQISLVDTSKQERTDAGDLRTDRGTLHKRLSFDLSMMVAADRNTLWNILRGSGTHSPIYCSLTPESEDAFEEQVFQVYGKLTRSSPIRYQYINQFSSQIELEEV